MMGNHGVNMNGKRLNGGKERALADIDEEAVRRAYARWAPIYDFTFGIITNAGRQQVIRQLNKRPPSRILEVGVGTGISLASYKPEHRITGIDLSPDMLERARARVRRQGLKNVEALLEMDAAAMDFPDNSFDIVVAFYVLTVVPDPQKVMREMARVCKPGGEVVVVNHFSQDGGLRGLIEKRLARYAENLGWRPEFPESEIMVCNDLVLDERRKAFPFGIFDILRLRKTPQASAAI